MSKIEKLQVENTKLKQKNTVLKEQNLELKAKNKFYEEQFQLMQIRKYTAKSEKATQGQLCLFDDILNEAESQSELKAEEPQI